MTAFPGVIGRLPGLLENADDDACIFTVVKALAYANYHGRYGSEEANEASRLHYGLALQQLAMLMSNPVQVQKDDALMVIFLFSLYEVCRYLYTDLLLDLKLTVFRCLHRLLVMAHG